MALRLRVVSANAEKIGSAGTKVFGVHGGSIGRAPGNEWVLPDPERFLSGKHLRIEFRAGKYMLFDTSSNGTYINSAQIPLGKTASYELVDGDYLRLGDTELLVSIDASNDFPPDDSAVIAYDGKPTSSVRKSTAGDIGSDLDLSELLEPSTLLEADSGIRANDAYGTSALLEREPDKAPWHMMTRPLSVEHYKAERANARAAAELAAEAGTPAYERSRGAVVFDPDIEAGLAAFCRGAGLDPQRIAAEARNAALQTAGQIVREVVLGLMELAQSRGEFKTRFHVASPPAEGPESPLTSGRSVDDALARLLSSMSVRNSGMEIVRGEFNELRGHQTAVLTSMRAAFEEFLRRLAPQELEERFERNAKKSVFGSGKGRNWELYTELYAAISQRPPEGFPHLFSETFARNYEIRFRELTGRKRGGETPIEDRAAEG
jgi:type VI secretion system protein